MVKNIIYKDKSQNTFFTLLHGSRQDSALDPLGGSQRS